MVTKRYLTLTLLLQPSAYCTCEEVFEKEKPHRTEQRDLKIISYSQYQSSLQVEQL